MSGMTSGGSAWPTKLASIAKLPLSKFASDRYLRFPF
jgi:hypothetical protein